VGITALLRRGRLAEHAAVERVVPGLRWGIGLIKICLYLSQSISSGVSPASSCARRESSRKSNTVLSPLTFAPFKQPTDRGPVSCLRAGWLPSPTAPVWQFPACEGAWAPGPLTLAARPAMAVPPAKGLDEACAWLRKAALIPLSHRSLL
jgi:hypothetical protein